LPILNPTVVNVGGVSTESQAFVEWDLDSQVIQSMAGGTLKQMLFYTATSFYNSALTMAYNKAMSEGIATVVNISIGECESYNADDGSMAADDAIFKLAIAQGQTFSVASGDQGATGCYPGFGVQYPASSPYVIAVGGTTLSTHGDHSYESESAWISGGGGPSAYEQQPSWQTGIVPGPMRGVPDIAFDGDGSSGAKIIVDGMEETWGGTSLASPLFVGTWARLQSLHGNSLGFPASWIYQYGNSHPSPAFHDVVVGSNGGYSANVGWDYTTGWGSFDVAAVNSVVVGVAGSPPAMPVQITPSNPLFIFTNNNASMVSVTPSTSGAPATSFTFCKTDDLHGQTCHVSTARTWTFSLLNGSMNTFQAQACNAAGCSGFIVAPTTVEYCRNYTCP
jgi:pseudomonalisin/xanthomonalisin